MESKDLQIEDVDQHYIKEGQSFKTIVLEQYRKCAVEGSKEMVVGGVDVRFINGERVEIPRPNQIEIFINSLDILKSLLYPHILKYSDFIGNKINKFEKNNENLKIMRIKMIKKLASEFESLPSTKSPEGLSKKDLKKEEYKMKRIEIDKKFVQKQLKLYKEELFLSLSELLAKLNYFDER